MENWFKNKAKLQGNPFTPSGTGLPNGNYVYLSARMEGKVTKFYDELSTGRGAKTFPLIGNYGAGKSAFMKGFMTDFFWKKKIKAFYIENPGVNFYSIANHVLQSLGRYEFSKALYEISEHYLSTQQVLFGSNYDAFLISLKTKSDRDVMIIKLQKILKDKVQLTNNENVAYSFAKLVIETKIRPFFDYKDFVSEGTSPSVPKDLEAEYFNALITAIKGIYGAEGVALLLDEFEELTLGARISSRVRYEYLSTFRKLIDESEHQNLWIVLAMVPGVEKIIEKINPPLWERFSHHGETTLSLEELDRDEITGIIEKWLNSMRTGSESKSIFPFERGIEDVFLSRSQLRFPRVVVKVCFQTLARASSENIDPPISKEYVSKIAEEFYPKRSEKKISEES